MELPPPPPPQHSTFKDVIPGGTVYVPETAKGLPEDGNGIIDNGAEMKSVLPGPHCPLFVPNQQFNSLTISKVKLLGPGTAGAVTVNE
jgi:hypothetical protein